MKNKKEKDDAKKVLDTLTNEILDGITAVKNGKMTQSEALTIVKQINTVQGNIKTILQFDHVDIQYVKAGGRESALKRKDRELDILVDKLKLDRDKFEHQKASEKSK